MKDLTFKNMQDKELKAIAKIRTKPKYFYSYAKRLSKTKQNISQLFNKEGKITTDRKQVADILQNQFVSAFSNPSNPKKALPSSANPSLTLADINFAEDDIIKAIDEIDTNSSCPDYCTPAIVLKRCKSSLVKPLLMMWKESFSTGVVPNVYKKQLITPVYKKGSRATAANYRPVSLTAHEIKIFERILRNKIMTYLEDNNLLLSKQHGFRKGRSCLTQLLQHHQDILLNLLNNEDTDAIFLDFAKAFDKVDYEILLQKLKNIGISGKLFRWIQNFLSGRTQVVVVDEILSFIAEVISGVPQGTVLGPLLFLIFLNDINCCIQHCDLKCFADDTRLSKSISTTEDCTLLQKDLDNVILWSISNNMQLHEDKFVYVNYNIRSKNFPLANLPFFSEQFQYSTDSGTMLEPSTTVCDLGITFTENLGWYSHICDIVKRARRKAGWVLSVFKDRSPYVMLSLFKTMVRSLLEYGCPLWIGLNQESTSLLESVQRSFTSKIICPYYVNDYWERLKYLNLMSLQRRRERYAILHMWKILHNLITNDLNITFNYSLRFGFLANIPPLSSNRRNHKAQSLYDDSFSVKGPQLWNLVPKYIKEKETLLSFKVNLDIYLQSVPDRPAVSGYPTQNNNSLLAWNTIRLLY